MAGEIGAGVASGALKGASLGVKLGSVVPGVGNVVGGIIGGIGGAISGLFGGKKKKRKREEAERRRLAALDKANEQLVLQQSKATLSQFPVSGIEGNQSFEDGGVLMFVNGGDLDGMSMNPDQIKAIANDMFAFSGPSHANGGIDIDTDNNGSTDAEVEGGETFQPSNNRVFSDKLRPTEGIKDAIKAQTGVTVDGTFADISKKLATYKDKFTNESSEAGKNSMQLVDERVNNALDLLFSDQQLQNNNNGNSEFAMGGKMKYDLGGILGGIGDAIGGVFGGGGAGSAVAGQLFNLGNFISNKNALNNVQTEQNPVLAPNPQFTFADRSALAKTEVANDVRTGIRNINRSSSQNNARAIAKLMAEKFRANNQINAQSQVDENNARNAFQNRVAQVGAANAATVNQTEAGNIARRNAVEAAKIDANNAFIQGVVGNIQGAQDAKMQAAQALLIAVQQGDRGTIERLLQRFPDLARTLGINPAALATPTQPGQDVQPIGIGNTFGVNPAQVSIPANLAA